MRMLLLTVQVLSSVVLMHTKQCDLEETHGNFYIYNTTVTISTYSCLFGGSDYKCKNKRNNLITKCREIKKSSLSPNDPSAFNTAFVEQADITVCKTSTPAKLLENKVVFSENKQCEYSYGNCNETDNIIFWEIDLCRDLRRIYSGRFSGYKNSEGDLKYIYSRNSSLQLFKAKDLLCGFDMWTTNYEDVIVSSQYIPMVSLNKQLPYFQSSLNDGCEVTTTSATVDATSDGESTTSEEFITDPEKRSSERKNATSLETVISEQTAAAEELKKSIYCMIVFVVVCGVWYTFNVIVNWRSLRKVSKARASRDRFCLINSLSQALTNHYIFVVSTESEEHELADMSNEEEPHIYHTVNEKF